MMKLCIIPCGKTKIWKKIPSAGPNLARNVYIGPFASTCRKYAEHFYPNSYMILSAKYGLLDPDDIIPGDYNVTFNNPATNPITANQIRKQAEVKNLLDIDEIVVLGGKRYIDILKKVFIGKKIINPLAGCTGNGEMAHKLLESIKKNILLPET